MILFVSDERKLSTIQLKKIKKIDFEIKFTFSHKEALEEFSRDQSINLIILDINNLDNPGEFIKKIFLQREVPIVYMSDNVEKEIKENLYNNFCSGYISLDDDDSDILFTIKMTLKLFKDNDRKKTIRETLYEINKEKSKKNMFKKELGYREMIQNHDAIMLVIDTKTSCILQANYAATKFYGWSQEEFKGMKMEDINTMSRKEVLLKLEKARLTKNTYFEFQHKLSDNSIRDVEVHSGPITMSNNGKVLAVIQDVTERKKSQKIIHDLAYYDSLTGLPNRRVFIDELKKLIYIGKEKNYKITLLNIDLDHFKNINDSFGHDTGDLLLIKVGKALKRAVDIENMIYRLGGDEFAIIIEGDSDHIKIKKICDNILNSLNNFFKIKNKEFFISASIGIAIYPNDGTSLKTLFKNSDLAMYKAKNGGKNKYCFFSKEMNWDLKNEVKMEMNLRKALKENMLKLYYQPKIDATKNEIIGLESLLRWVNDEGEYIPPSVFIPLAEKSKLILEIDRWVFMETCRQIDLWEKMGIKDQKVSINISGDHFKQGRILKTITKISEVIKIPFDSIEIEITEGVFLENVEDAISILEEIKLMGISISIDDFGTGYSSLNYLKKLPIDRIKIDKSFVDNIVGSKKDRAIVQTIITMTESLDLKVIAEGAELFEQIEILNQMGCYEIQGYYFAKPMPAEDYNLFFEKWNQNNLKIKKPSKI